MFGRQRCRTDYATILSTLFVQSIGRSCRAKWNDLATNSIVVTRTTAGTHWIFTKRKFVTCSHSPFYRMHRLTPRDLFANRYTCRIKMYTRICDAIRPAYVSIVWKIYRHHINVRPDSRWCPLCSAPPCRRNSSPRRKHRRRQQNAHRRPFPTTIQSKTKCKGKPSATCNAHGAREQNRNYSGCFDCSRINNTHTFT